MSKAIDIVGDVTLVSPEIAPKKQGQFASD